MADLPIVCTLSPDALEARRQDLLGGLVRRAEKRCELPNGYKVRFTPADEILSTIARVIEAERRCCRFLEFSVSVAPDDGPIWLEVTGPPGTREFLTGLFDL